MLYAAFDRCLEDLELSEDERLGVAVSGGRDSMCLADLARRRLGSRAVVLHVDHGLRAEAAADARFVAEWCDKHGLPHAMGRLEDVGPDEASLREGRYRELERLRSEAGLRWVLLAHHRDDQAETALMRLLTRGRIEGMPERRGPFVRPLLRVSSDLIAGHAQRRGVPWREDRSNRDPRWLRNRVRRELLPLLEEVYRPGFRRRLAAQMASRPGFVAWITDWPAPVGPNVVVFDAERVESPCYRPIAEEDRWAELGPRLSVLRARGAWIVADGARLLWAPGYVAPDAGPEEGTTRAWIFEWK
jgi:tRNA(Ile)-lysidine synthetase-like protein